MSHKDRPCTALHRRHLLLLLALTLNLALASAQAFVPSVDAGYSHGNLTNCEEALSSLSTPSHTAIPSDTVTFTDVSVAAGFFGNQSSWAGSWGDYDNDGYIDVVTLGHAQSLTHSISQLWHNNGDGTFSDVTIAAGQNPGNGDAHGAIWADFDKDGYLDLFVSKGTPKGNPNNYNDFWHNNGDGTFTNIAGTSGLFGKSHRERGAYAVDYDLDSDLDILDTSFQTANQLFRNDGGLVFTDVAPEAGITRDVIENRTAAWADYDGDGLPDFLITKDCALYKNLGDGTFLDVTAAAGISPLGEGEAAAWGDYNSDGHPDLYITTDAKRDQAILYRNNGDGTFTDVTAASGVVNTNGALGATWADYDNDGFLDLYIVNTEQGTTVPNRLFRNNGDGTFTDVALTAGAGAKPGIGRGSDASFIDYNNDGFLDLFVCNGAGSFNGPYVLLKNNGTSPNGWLKIILKGVQSNINGFGAKLLLKAGGQKQFREYFGQHYMSQNCVPAHFGLGTATNIDVLTVLWPSGIKQTLRNVAPNQTITITEASTP